METKFYYLRDEAKRPLVTVCLARDENGKHYRGVAICSPKDSPVKRVGRQIALGRVLRAIHRNGDTGRVLRVEAWDVLSDAGAFNQYNIKSAYNPILTPLEIKILNKSKENHDLHRIPELPMAHCGPD